MKKYDGLNNSYGTHTVRVHLQDDEYKGWVELKLDGNCAGRNVLDVAVTEIGGEDYGKPKTDGMKITWNYEYNCFAVILKNDKGDTCEYEITPAELDNMIVCLEIVDFERRTKNGADQ